MTLFVTGGSGFIGSAFLRYWNREHPEDALINFDALTYAASEDAVAELENSPGYRFIKGDITDRDAVRAGMQGADIVVHFAAETHVDRSIMNPSIFVKTNVLGTQVLLDIAREIGVKRFHHVSTDEVFGSLELGSSKKFSEQTPYDPRSPYSASKAGSDHLVRSAFHTYGLPITITNCSNNYGAFQFPEKLIPLVITNILEKKPIPVYGEGNQVRDWLFVDDHCRAIDLVLQGGVVGETYCVGGLQKDVTNLEVVKLLLSLAGESEDLIEHVQDRSGHDVRYAVDWTKINHELGWSPSVSLAEGLEKTFTWYKTHPDVWKKMKSEGYEAYYKKQYEDRDREMQDLL